MKKIIPFTIAVIIIILFYFSITIIPQTDFGYCRASKTNSVIFLNPGPHLHWPWTKIHLEDSRPQLLTTNTDGTALNVTVTTFDKHEAILTYHILWQPSNRLIYLQAPNHNTLRLTLVPIVNQALQTNAITITMPELARQLNDPLKLNQLLGDINAQLAPVGVNVLNVNITNIRIAESERASWVNLMQSEQDLQLDALQKQTATLNQDLRNATDTKILQLLKNGEEQAAKIKGDGDLAATQVYADAYHQSPEFYEFFHRLQLYKQLLNNKQDVLVLSTHTPFLNALSNSSAANNK